MELDCDLAHSIWDAKYRWRDGGLVRDRTIDDTWRRVAAALAAPEESHRTLWESRFYDILRDHRFLPGGRILAGAGTNHHVTLFNCFVMAPIEDSVDGIFQSLKEGAITMQHGGGVGYDFSTLRPAHDVTHGVGTIASGPVSFMHVWDSMCATIVSTGARRGAMMGTLRCDHPDIERFVAAKRDPRALHHFNLSVLVSDAFMTAVNRDADWPLLFPLQPGESCEGEIIEREWPGHVAGTPCRVRRWVRARTLWQAIVEANYESAEPGLLFIDTVRRRNALAYDETIVCTNPCGEVPLPAYGACDLGSINLTRFVREPFESGAWLDVPAIESVAGVATRLLDNVYEIAQFPLPVQEHVARRSRRLGLGITGLGDALTMLGIPYGSDESLRLADEVMGKVCHAAYRASIALAREKGAFPAFEARPYLAGEFIRGLPADIREGIASHGIRNSHLTAIAPTGTISLLAGNVSSGVEPVFAPWYTRYIRNLEGEIEPVRTTAYSVRLYAVVNGLHDGLPPALRTADQVDPLRQITLQAALQRHVDNAISKTVTVPVDVDLARFTRLFEQAHALGLKGLTTYRPNPITGATLTAGEPQPDACCMFFAAQASR